MDSQKLIDLIDDAGYAARGYEVNGVRRVAFTIHSELVLGAVANMIEVAAINYGRDVVHELAGAFGTAKTDPSSRDYVTVYFPSYKLPEEAKAAS